MSSRTAKIFANLKAAAAVVQPREGDDLVQNSKFKLFYFSVAIFSNY